MPGFTLDVHGLETTFKTLDGVMHAVNCVSFGLNEGQTLGVVVKVAIQAFTAGVIGVKDNRVMFQTVSYSARSIFKRALTERDLSSD